MFSTHITDSEAGPAPRSELETLTVKLLLVVNLLMLWLPCGTALELSRE